MYLGQQNDIRILVSYYDRKVDLKHRQGRLRKASFFIKKRLEISRIGKRKQKKVEACCESTALFDIKIRSWTNSEINTLQKAVDKTYRYIWSSKKEPPLIEMEKTGTNRLKVRNELQIDSIHLKIEKRSLQRIGHLLGMDNERTTRKMVL